jgi:hypothetical protein
MLVKNSARRETGFPNFSLRRDTYRANTRPTWKGIFQANEFGELLLLACTNSRNRPTPANISQANELNALFFPGVN